MEVITIESEAFKNIVKEIESIQKQIAELKQPAFDEWLTSAQICDRYKFSSRTLQNYRDRAIIPFVQIGSKILYNAIQVDEAINHFQVK